MLPFHPQDQSHVCCLVPACMELAARTHNPQQCTRGCWFQRHLAVSNASFPNLELDYLRLDANCTKNRPSRALFFFFFKSSPEDMLIDLREIGRGRQKHPTVAAPTRDWTCSLGMCPDQELNPAPCGLRTMLQPTEPQQARAGHLLIECRMGGTRSKTHALQQEYQPCHWEGELEAMLPSSGSPPGPAWQPSTLSTSVGAALPAVSYCIPFLPPASHWFFIPPPSRLLFLV